MSKPEQTALPKWAAQDAGIYRIADGEVRQDAPAPPGYVFVTPLAEAQAEIERLTAEHATALERQALYLALMRDAQRVATEANARSEAVLADARRLREVLKPFAEFGRVWLDRNSHAPEPSTFYALGTMAGDFEINASHFRAALAATVETRA